MNLGFTHVFSVAVLTGFLLSGVLYKPNSCLSITKKEVGEVSVFEEGGRSVLNLRFFVYFHNG